MGFVLVAYYTANSIYKDSAMLLLDAARKLGILAYAEEIPDQGGWCENTNYKPQFIKKCMNMFPDYSIAYTDADSMIHSYPTLFDSTNANILIRCQNFPHRKNEFMSGTFLIRNNQECRNIVESWINKVESNVTTRENPMSWEQYRFGEAILESGIAWSQLPHDYIYFDHIERAEGKVESPVITHMQYSRRLKHAK